MPNNSEARSEMGCLIIIGAVVLIPMLIELVEAIIPLVIVELCGGKDGFH